MEWPGYVSSKQLDFHTYNFSKEGNWKRHASNWQELQRFHCWSTVGRKSWDLGACLSLLLWKEPELSFSWVPVSSAYSFKTISCKSSVDAFQVWIASLLLHDLPRSAPKHENQPEIYAYLQKKKGQWKGYNYIGFLPKEKNQNTHLPTHILIIFFNPLCKILIFMTSFMDFLTSEYRNIWRFLAGESMHMYKLFTMYFMLIQICPHCSYTQI